MALTLHLQQVPARNGRLWVRHGFKVFQRAPLALSGLFAAFMFFSTLLMLLPGPFRLLVLMGLPLMSLGFMLATHLVLQGKRPSLSVFIAPLKLTRERRNTQLLLGLSYAIALMGALMLLGVADGGAFDQAVEQFSAQMNANSAALPNPDPALFTGMLLRMGTVALLAVPFWHAPALVHWGGQGVLQALFSSTLGIWRNKGAFSLFALSWLGLLLASSWVLSLVFGLLGAVSLLPVITMLLSWLLSTVFYASLYFSFVDCFLFGAPKTLD